MHELELSVKGMQGHTLYAFFDVPRSSQFFFLLQTGGGVFCCQFLPIILGMALLCFFPFCTAKLTTQGYKEQVKPSVQTTALSAHLGDSIKHWINSFLVSEIRTSQLSLTSCTQLKDVSLICHLMLNAFVG